VTLLSQLDRRAYSGHLESILGIEEQNPVDAQEQEQEQAAPVREREREQEREPEKEKVKSTHKMTERADVGSNV
jgi:hypothetical protein